jgi:hypothetical protein
MLKLGSWIPISTMKCSGLGENVLPFLKHCHLSRWIFVVVIVEVGYSKKIFFLLSCYKLDFELEFVSFYLCSINYVILSKIRQCCANKFCGTQQIFGVHIPLLVTLLWLWFGLVVFRLDLFDLSLVLWVMISLTMLLLWWICRPELLVISLLKFMLNSNSILISKYLWGYVQEICLYLDVHV